MTSLPTRPSRFPAAPTPARISWAVLVAWGLGFGAPSLASSADKAATTDGWPEITQEEKKLTSIPQDPEADVVLLRNEREGKLVKPGDEWMNQLHYHWRLKVLKPGGKRYGEVHIRGQKYSRVSDIEARTIKPDGTIVPVAKEQIFDKTVFQVGDFKISEKVFNFPAVEPGAILEYQYDRRDDYLLAIDPWYFEGPEFTLYSHVTQAVPNGFGYLVMCDLCEGTKPEVGKWREGKQQGESYSVTLRNLSGYREEEFMPPRREISPRLELVMQTWRDIYWQELGRQDTLFSDWGSVSKFVNSHYQKTIKDGQAEFKPVVDGWIQGITDPQEKVRAIFKHVQEDFRYIPWENVLGGSRSLSTLLKAKTADNEEKAVLLLGALRAAGLEGDFVLVSGNNVGSINPKFLGLTQFSHTIVDLPGPNGTHQYLDPTLAYSPPTFVSWKDSGAGALFLKGGQGETGTLPVKNELSTARFSVKVKPRPDAKADLEIEARFTGEDAIDLREALVPASETARADLIKEWLDEAKPGATLVAQSIQDVDKPDQPLVLSLKAEAGNLVTLAEGIEVVRGCVLFCRDSNPISNAARKHPFYVDRGWNVSQEVLIVPPAGMKAASMPAGVTASSSLGSLTMSCASREEEGVVCRRQFTVRRNRWDASERDGIRAMYDKIVQADNIAVSFEAESAGK